MPEQYSVEASQYQVHVSRKGSLGNDIDRKLIESILHDEGLLFMVSRTDLDLVKCRIGIQLYP